MDPVNCIREFYDLKLGVAVLAVILLCCINQCHAILIAIRFGRAMPRQCIRVKGVCIVYYG